MCDDLYSVGLFGKTLIISLTSDGLLIESFISFSVVSPGPDVRAPRLCVHPPALLVLNYGCNCSAGCL